MTIKNFLEHALGCTETQCRLKRNETIDFNTLFDKAEEFEKSRYSYPLTELQREVLEKVEKDLGIIVYNPDTKGFKVAPRKNTLVAYLWGRLYCGDWSDKYGSWIKGGDIDKTVNDFFDFDVQSTRNRGDALPKGYQQIDNIIDSLRNGQVA